MTRATVQATWDDVPHLNEQQKRDLWDSLPPHEREARAKGIPSLGVGKVYPVDEALILCEPFSIPAYWPKAYGLDVGWNRTACIWGAWDRDSDVVYLWSEYYAGQMPPAVHAAGVAARGPWIPGAIDPASAGANQRDGETLMDEYRALGLSLLPADNAVEAGLFAVYQRMARGGLQVFSTLRNWLAEYRIYRRDDKGKVVKENDHLMDATRYLIMTGMRSAMIDPGDQEEMERRGNSYGRSSVTGY